MKRLLLVLVITLSTVSAFGEKTQLELVEGRWTVLQEPLTLQIDKNSTTITKVCQTYSSGGDASPSGGELFSVATITVKSKITVVETQVGPLLKLSFLESKEELNFDNPYVTCSIGVSPKSVYLSVDLAQKATQRDLLFISDREEALFINSEDRGGLVIGVAGRLK